MKEYTAETLDYLVSVNKIDQKPLDSIVLNVSKPSFRYHAQNSYR
jgi:hypothetical protein